MHSLQIVKKKKKKKILLITGFFSLKIAVGSFWSRKMGKRYHLHMIKSTLLPVLTNPYTASKLCSDPSLKG